MGIIHLLKMDEDHGQKRRYPSNLGFIQPTVQHLSAGKPNKDTGEKEHCSSNMGITQQPTVEDHSEWVL